MIGAPRVSMAKRNRDALAIASLIAGLGLMLWGPGLILAGLGATVYTVAATLLPRAGLGGVVATLPLYLLPRQLGGLAISMPEATLLLCTVAVGLRGLAGRLRGQRGVPALCSGAFDPPIALFLAAALLSLLVSEYLRLSLRELRTLIVEPLVFFYLARHVIRTVEDASRMLDVLLAAATIVALIGIAQFFVGGAVTDVEGVRRVQGTYTSPNHLGLLLGRVVPFLLAGVWLLPRRWPRAAAAAICVSALGLTFSLGAWLGTLAALLALAALLGGRRALAMAAVGAAILATVVILAILAVPALRVERLAARLDPAQGTTLVRLQLWQASLAVLREQPLLGIGLDNFVYRYPSYVPSGVVMEPNLSHPHNLILQLWLQLGLAGVVAMAWLLTVFIRRVLPRARGSGPPAERALAAGALASMTDFVVHGAIDNSYFLVDMAFIFWLTIAVGNRLALRSESSSVSS